MSQEVGVRSISDLRQFANDLRTLSEQLTNAFHMAEKKMHAVCDGWSDNNNIRFMEGFTESTKQIDKIATQMSDYSTYIGKSCEILELYQQNRMK